MTKENDVDDEELSGDEMIEMRKIFSFAIEQQCLTFTINFLASQ